LIKITNDLNTLNGSLVEMKDQLIYELGQQGVTATFDPTTGLLGLIAHIADISGGGATVSNLTLTTNKSILSYYDSDTCTLTATATDSNNQAVNGAKIIFLQNNTIIGSATTDNTGTATYTYTSTGTGDTTITAITDNATANIQIEDCLYYGNWDKIKTWLKYTGISGRNIYNLKPNYQTDVSLEWQLSDATITNWLIGFGQLDGTYNDIKAMIFRYSNAYQMWTTAPNEGPYTKGNMNNVTSSTVFKLETTNLNTVKFYADNNLAGTYTTSNTLPLYLRVDDFTASPLTLNYLKVKPL